MKEFFDFMARVIERQKKFQEVREDIDLDRIDDLRRNQLAEAFLNRATQEVFELLRTQPEGVLGQKNPKDIDRSEMLGELADVHLFLINFMIVRAITWEELLETIPGVQQNNFNKALEKLRRRQETKENAINEILSTQ